MRAPKSYINKVNMSDLNNKDQTTVCSMTPCFVHAIYLVELNDGGSEASGKELFVLAGIENGLCFCLRANHLAECEKSIVNEQLQSLNCALTQFGSLNDECLVACGNGKAIELFNVNQLNGKTKINKLNTIDHSAKINSAKCKYNKLFLTDTTNCLTVYDFNK